MVTSISVVVPTFNRVRSLSKALDALALQEPRAPFEVVVIDNASTDGTRDLVQTHKAATLKTLELRYVQESIPGLLSGRHRGLRETTGALVVFIDDDVEPAPDWLASIEDAFSDPEVEIVGGRSKPQFEVDPPEWLQTLWTEDSVGRRCEWFSLIDLGDRRRRIDPDLVWGLNFSIRRDTLMALGGFHPDNMPKRLQRFQGDGETGLTRKAGIAGVVAVYEPGAEVKHAVSAQRMTLGYLEERAFYQGVCDSFADYRAAAGRFDLKKASVRVLSRTGALARSGRGHPSKSLRRALLQAQVAGQRFHRYELRRSPSLRQWVRRDTYWDYRFPSD